ncbi:LpqB family beta-propeller domain-containing protein [Xylanimonas protaetiae]|uniref:GerMN domain-containing protein n=1 Tax=Xylanimonas protaetiae TaxID=2509457 RepID=A0A4P6F6M7_9MICO|nr:LpqB family beta-propeller domain-containing protein [Xylanimonas protaetiae]QAY68867.1 hypothetical protein ET471_01415 [Xylanimonas protaetiae]
MSLRTRARTAAAAVAALAVAVLAGCASMPVSGAVNQGGDDVPRTGDFGQIAFGPTADADPEAIVRGFLRATQAGPTSAASFAVAREYLTKSAAETWSPSSRVLVTDVLPQPVLADGSDPTSDRVVVHASATVVASLDERGVFSEEQGGVETTFELAREGGQWRISHLDDGLMVPSPTFGSTFHVTTLYFPTPDLRSWVPDVRWFPQTTWRTSAVQQLLAGPPEYLAGAASAMLPVGTGLSASVTEGPDGTFQVLLTDQASEASGTARGVFAAQVRATLAEGRGAADVVLSDRNGPIVPTEVDVPELPHTPGRAVALQGGKLMNVTGRTLEQSELVVHLEGLDPQALAVSQAGDTVVVRDGVGRLVRVTGQSPSELLTGTWLLPPSIDRVGTVWTGDRGGPLVVVTPAGDRFALDVDWLEGRTVTSVRVSPEGARVAVVSSGEGGSTVQVAGIVRDARGVPTALASPVTVGASVTGVEQAVWQEESVLALLSRDESGATSVYLAGVGGLHLAVGGLPRRIGGISDPTWLSASVGSGDLLAIDGAGVLHVRQTTALWPVVGTGVQLAAFAG